MTVRLQGGVLTIIDPDGTLRAAWAATEIQRGDGHVAGADAVLRRAGAAERLVLHDPVLLAALGRQGAAVSSASTWARGTWAALAAGFVAAIGVAWLLVDQLPALLAPFVPQRLEQAWSSQAEALFSSTSRACEGPGGTQALTQLMARLSTAAGLPRPPPFQVLDTPMVNAFTLPDGHILILRGLIDSAEDSNELAGVLAHELGHVQHHDPTREMLRRLALNMTARSLGWGGGIATTITALSYGRHAEAAADASAIDTLQAAGLRADGLGRFFTLLQRRNGAPGLPAYLSDHPATADRARRLRVPAGGVDAMGAADWRAVRGICRDGQ